MRLDYIDYAKAFAILLVVAGHVLNYDFYDNYTWTDSPLHRWIYSFHMPLFMFLSGLVSVTSINACSIKNDLLKRFRRLIVPAVIFGGIYSAIFFNGFIEIFTDQYKQGYWYLFVLFELYVINYIPALISSNRSLSVFYSITLLLCIIFSRHISAFPQQVDSTFVLSQLFVLTPFFFFGNAVKRYNWHTFVFGKISFVVSLCVWIKFNNFSLVESIPTAITDSNYYVGHIVHYLHDLIRLLIILCKVLCVVSACKLLSAKVKQNKWLLIIGQNTLYIYIFHWYFIRCMVMTDYKEWFYSHASYCFDIAVVIFPSFIIIVGCVCIKHLLFKSKTLSKLIFFT